MFSSIAAAPASCIAVAYRDHPPGVTPLRLPITGISTAVAERSSRLRYRRGPGSDSAGSTSSGKYDRASPKLSAPAPASRLSRSASRSSCSSNKEYSTTAPTPPSASCRTPSTVCDIGDGEATSGLRNVMPRYRVVRSMSRLPAWVGGETVRAPGGHFLVHRPALVDRLLREFQQSFRLDRVGVHQRAVPQFPVDVV